MSRSHLYILDEAGEPLRVDDPAAWAEWINENRGAQRVGVADVADARVSTVFRGVDVSWGAGPALVFETFVFGGAHDMSQWLWCTHAQAVAGHARIVAALREGREPEPDGA